MGSLKIPDFFVHLLNIYKRREGFQEKTPKISNFFYKFFKKKCN